LLVLCESHQDAIHISVLVGSNKFYMLCGVDSERFAVEPTLVVLQQKL
jgi:hypothetical protein